MAITQIARGTSVPVTFTVIETGKVKDMSICDTYRWSVKLKGYPTRGGLDFEVNEDEDNPFSLTIHTTPKTATGVYVISFTYNEEGQQRVVTADAFRLVEYSGNCGFDSNCNCIACVTADTGIGMVGPRGPQGVQGPQGLPGSDGKSAYQYAQESGFSESEEEFSRILADAVTKTDMENVLGDIEQALEIINSEYDED